jgi:hypothetical protein
MLPIGMLDYRLNENGDHTTTDEKGNIVPVPPTQVPMAPPPNLRQQIEAEKAAYRKSRDDELKAYMLQHPELFPPKPKSLWESLFGR